MVANIRLLNLRPSNLQLMPWNFQIQYSYFLIERFNHDYYSSDLKPSLQGHVASYLQPLLKTPGYEPDIPTNTPVSLNSNILQLI
jgi:hypothetical protein